MIQQIYRLFEILYSVENDFVRQHSSVVSLNVSFIPFLMVFQMDSTASVHTVLLINESLPEAPQ